MEKIRILKVAFLVVSSLAIAALGAVFGAQPAQAKFGLLTGYKYVAVLGEGGDDVFDVHVGQLDFLWTIRGGGTGYRDGGKRPRQVFGFALAIGGNQQKLSTDQIGQTISSQTIIQTFDQIISQALGVGNVQYDVYFALPLIYEYVFPFGLGISGGITSPLMVSFGGDAIEFGTGFGISDLGLSYHFNNGLTLYGRGNIGYASFFGGSIFSGVGTQGGLMWGAGGGIGYWF